MVVGHRALGNKHINLGTAYAPAAARAVPVCTQVHVHPPSSPGLTCVRKTVTELQACLCSLHSFASTLELLCVSLCRSGRELHFKTRAVFLSPSLVYESLGVYLLHWFCISNWGGALAVVG